MALRQEQPDTTGRAVRGAEDRLANRLRHDAAAVHRPAPADLHDRVMRRLNGPVSAENESVSTVLGRIDGRRWPAALAACLVIAGGVTAGIALIGSSSGRLTPTMDIAADTTRSVVQATSGETTVALANRNEPGVEMHESTREAPSVALVDRLFSINLKAAATPVEQPLVNEARAIVRAGEAVLDGALAYLPPTLRSRFERP